MYRSLILVRLASIFIILTGGTGLWSTRSPAPPPGPARTSPLSDPGNRPLYFERNDGQANPSVRFLSRGSRCALFLTGTEAVFALHPGLEDSPSGRDSVIGVRMKVAAANRDPRIEGLDPLAGKVHYFVGDDPSKWQGNIPTFARVRYGNVQPGIDLVFYGSQRRPEFDFIVSPGADPEAIAFLLETTEEPQGAP